MLIIYLLVPWVRGILGIYNNQMDIFHIRPDRGRLDSHQWIDSSTQAILERSPVQVLTELNTALHQ